MRHHYASRADQFERLEFRAGVKMGLESLRWFLLLLGIAAAAGFYVYWRSNAQTATHEIAKLRPELELQSRLVENLSVQLEQLTDGTYILARARVMGLREPVQGQVRRVYPRFQIEDETADSTGLAALLARSTP